MIIAHFGFLSALKIKKLVEVRTEKVLYLNDY